MLEEDYNYFNCRIIWSFFLNFVLYNTPLPRDSKQPDESTEEYDAMLEEDYSYVAPVIPEVPEVMDEEIEEKVRVMIKSLENNGMSVDAALRENLKMQFMKASGMSFFFII